ncbi:MAG: hypothetical protein A3G18_07445 [Rhodospirillales bacterium RIFCSPLOWO2_12_FULL_58_28]|nr:MAG: hypothetical protein A3H92_08915 [Rhodospirillales bacterium RIFCSPLOWO2_02_FULL_58_16]OHC77559.1 MAG: hypothetical protein A3G18_07445 [Rhodospirillales bacterium RIFCSPLOWO2_12_FULL_58_28]
MSSGGDSIERDEENIRNALAALEPSLRKTIYTEITAATKDPDTYAALNWFFVCGLHHFYAGYILRGVINISVFAIGIGLIIYDELEAGLIVIGVISAVEMFDLFRSQSIIKNINNMIALNILHKHGINN